MYTVEWTKSPGLEGSLQRGIENRRTPMRNPLKTGSCIGLLLDLDMAKKGIQLPDWAVKDGSMDDLKRQRTTGEAPQPQDLPASAHADAEDAHEAATPPRET